MRCYRLATSVSHRITGGLRRSANFRLLLKPASADHPDFPIGIVERCVRHTFPSRRGVNEPAATGAHRNRFERNIVLDNGPGDEKQLAAIVIRGHHHELVFRQNTIGRKQATDKQQAGILVSRHAAGFQSTENQFRNVETNVAWQKD